MPIFLFIIREKKIYAIFFCPSFVGIFTFSLNVINYFTIQRAWYLINSTKLIVLGEKI